MADIRTRIRHWWNEKNAQPDIPNTPVSQDILHLFRLRREHRLLRLRFNGLGQDFQSLLLEVDLRNRRLILDEPFPAVDETRLVAGRRVDVASIEGAASTRFESRVEGLQQHRDLPALVLAMPESVTAFQRRNFFRLAVQEHMPVQAVLRHQVLGNLSARVLDLSSRGVRISVPSLEEHDPLQTAPFLLKLAGDRGFLCTLRVCSQHSSLDQESSVLGGALEGLNPPQLQLIERFIARSQRTQRQRELALETP